MVKVNQEKVSENQVRLVEGQGTKDTGGGLGGYYWHVFLKDTRVGRVFINRIEDHKTNISYASITVELNQKSRGRGIGSIVFRRACELSQYNQVFAEMRKSNIASRIAAERAGFRPVPDYQGKQLRMVWQRSSAIRNQEAATNK